MSMNTNSYFTIETLTAGNVWLVIHNGDGTENIGTIYYWINSTPNTNRDNYDGSIVPSSTTQYILINGSHPPVGSIIKLYRAETTRLNIKEEDSGPFLRIGGTAETKISGNIASLVGFTETIPTYCFRYMFYSSNVVDASELDLPWTTLNNWCFGRMFMGSTKLVYPPYLPAVTLAENCYQWMFRACTKLNNIAQWGAKVLANNSCYAMYQLSGGFTSVTIPIADTYYYHAFDRFLAGNKSITEAVVKTPESVTASGVFYYLFDDCTNLSKITCLLKSWDSDNQFANWTRGIAATGTFIKHPDATWSTGNSGIPSGWTVKNMNPQTQTIDYSKVTAAYVKGNTSLSAIYGKGGTLLWSKNTNI